MIIKREQRWREISLIYTPRNEGQTDYVCLSV